MRLLHLSDIQLADVKSPGRYEWVNSFYGVEGFEELIPGYRAQEFLVAHALVAMVRKFNELIAGEDRVCAIVTGDSIDNSQHNEINNFVAAIGGGVVSLQSGDEAMTLVAAHGFGDSSFWHPEPGDDDFKRLWGFPTLEGLLVAAFGPILSPGISCDWYVTNGNHEVLLQGLGVTNDEAAAVVVGGAKQVAPSRIFDHDVSRVGIEAPAALLQGGKMREVAPDPARHFVDRRTLASSIRNAAGTPSGHGLANDEYLYYAAELNDEVVLLCLDTAFNMGGAEGAIDAVQARWLVDKLRRYSSTSFSSDDGELEGCDGDDRLIVVAAHHPLATLTNGRAGASPDFYLGDWLLATLLRFPNVVAFVNGHTHENRVQIHRGHGRELLEVTTSALMDWPCEARSLEISVDENAVWVTGVMVNFEGVATPRYDDRSAEGLAAWHRLLAANSPALTLAPHHNPEGGVHDRNFIFRIERPAWLHS